MTIRSTTPYREFATELVKLAGHGYDLSAHPGIASIDAALKSVSQESAATINLLPDTIEEQNRALVAHQALAA